MGGVNPPAHDGRNKFRTSCKGPRLLAPSKTLVNTGSQSVTYTAAGGRRKYYNIMRVSACPTHKFWNQNGYLRCVK